MLNLCTLIKTQVVTFLLHLAKVILNETQAQILIHHTV